MRKTIIASAVIAVLSVPAIAVAEEAAPAASPFTGNMTIDSEYLYRGIAQTRGKPALQGGFDYAHSSGVYVGIWGSNISWISDAVPGASASLEVDIYGGYKGTAGPIGYDVGVLTYNYPGTGKTLAGTQELKQDTTEVYGAVTWQFLTVKYSHSTTALFGWSKAGTMTDKTTGSGYLEVNAAFDLGNGFGVSGHVGHQKVKGRDNASYTDLKIGATKDVGVGVIGLYVSGTDGNADCAKADAYCSAKPSTGRTYDAGKTRVVATFGKTF
ncbi:MAG: hypothetical protein HZC22_14955 [Rhodocyclales bacterium]|nr:hypothetical protein [Rhodocyclales bacterium]